MIENEKYYLPVIATRGVIIFPEQEIMIEVGREKSINAVNNAMDKYDGNVFVVSQNDITIDDPTQDDIFEYGTMCQIQSVRKKDGYYRVIFKGISRAKLINLEENKNILNANIICEEEILGDENYEIALVKKIIKEFEVSNSITSNFPPEVISNLTKGVSAISLSDQFAQYYPISIDAKQQLLETVDVNERLMLIIDYIQKEKEIVKIDNQIDSKVKERIEVGQREYYLREKLRVIKEELGDVSNVNDDTTTLKEMIENNPYPKHVKEKALEELKRYEMLPSSSAESSVVRNYLDWLLKTPWYLETEDNNNLNDVINVLNKDHYGLEKVKDRIMEYLAVKQMTNSLKSPILCLVGPPGVGKTSLAKSISKALGRTFVKMSVGGVKDESEIRGHRRTYLGSMPGRIIQGMKKAQVINPVFLIDEIDKLGYDYKGDPSSAMLEVLDPEQNSQFSDHYLEEAYDLSKVMFIATANYLGNIPEALRDRLEIINLSSYTELEKVNIAKTHLVKKQVLANGLKMTQFKLSEKEIMYLIRHYTREAGVRQLERIIAKLCRKTVLEILKEDKKSIKITKDLIVEWLGKEMFEYGKKENSSQVGVVTGLAYTSFGGDVLPVEVTYFKGKGRLIVTGQLGEVMKESTEIALDYIKSNSDKYGIDSKFFEENDIHIHVPEGAVPKDGPSAGITLTTAIISAITNKPVRSDIAMTGEVTLRGNVLPIGGLREKSLAAHRVGIKNIIIPKNNVKDLDELPDIIKENINFIPVDKVDTVLKEAIIK